MCICKYVYVNICVYAYIYIYDIKWNFFLFISDVDFCLLSLVRSDFIKIIIHTPNVALDLLLLLQSQNKN